MMFIYLRSERTHGSSAYLSVRSRSKGLKIIGGAEVSVIRMGASSWPLLASTMVELFSCFATGIAVAVKPVVAARHAHQAMRPSSIAGCGLSYGSSAKPHLMGQFALRW